MKLQDFAEELVKRVVDLHDKHVERTDERIKTIELITSLVAEHGGGDRKMSLSELGEALARRTKEYVAPIEARVKALEAAAGIPDDQAEALLTRMAPAIEKANSA